MIIFENRSLPATIMSPKVFSWFQERNLLHLFKDVEVSVWIPDDIVFTNRRLRYFKRELRETLKNAIL